MFTGVQEEENINLSKLYHTQVNDLRKDISTCYQDLD